MGFFASEIVPPQIEAATVVRFSVAPASYSAAVYTLSFVLNKPGSTPLITAATPDGNGFDVLLTSASTAALPVGDYAWGLYAADTQGNRTPVDRGSTVVVPSLFAPQPLSTAATILQSLESGMTGLATGTIQSFSGGGQNWSKKNMSELKDQIVFWGSRVMAEKRTAAAQNGCAPSGLIVPRFVSPNCGEPYGYGQGRNGGYP